MILNILLPVCYITFSQSIIIVTWIIYKYKSLILFPFNYSFFRGLFFYFLLFLKCTLGRFCHKSKWIQSRGRYAKWVKKGSYKTIWSGQAYSERGGKSYWTMFKNKERESKKVKTLFKQNQNISDGKFLIFQTVL